jgi:hypothetical protein
MTSHPTITCPCPRYVLPRLISILKLHGARVTPDNLDWGPPHGEVVGIVEHDSGKLSFHQQDGKLTITILYSPGHFPTKLLIGGIKQLVEETVESEQKSRSRTHVL